MTDESSTATFMALRLRLRNAAAAILRRDDEVDDAMQELFLRTWRHNGNVENRKAYMFASLRNICIDLLRHRRPAAEIEPDSVKAETSSAVENRDTAEYIRNIVATKLTDIPRKVFELYVYENLDYDEIASKLDITVQSARMAMSRARKTIRLIINKEQS